MSEHRIGNWYRLEKGNNEFVGSVYLLCVHAAGYVRLYNLETGCAWVSPVAVGDVESVSSYEMDRVCGGKIFRLVHKAGED
ncbi:MAG: hypothetical protein Unbinned5081contig1000_49 [Prokaryotic dsDNA virus sp.]|nr:MAG: hypothetical protein Unbinned5081contig1000_49 [Prokaryotic dsDNA virus sp.]